MANIQSQITIIDNASRTFNNINASANSTIQILNNLNSTMSSGIIDTTSIYNTNAIDVINSDLHNLSNTIRNISPIDIPIEPIEIPRIEFENTGIFDNRAISDLNQEINSIEVALNNLANNQRGLTEQSRNVDILPDNAMQDISNLDREIQNLINTVSRLDITPSLIDSNEFSNDLTSLRNDIFSTIEAQNRLSNNILDIDINTDDINNLNEQLNDTEQNIRNNTSAQERFNQSIANIPDIEPFNWSSYDSIDLFTNSGIDRFNQEIISTHRLLDNVSSSQIDIMQNARNMDILPDNAMQDINNTDIRIQNLISTIRDLEMNAINDIGAEQANNQIEELRRQLQSTIVLQNQLSNAMQNMDIGEANRLYNELNSQVDRTERYIRDNISAQDRFNNSIVEGNSLLNNMYSNLLRMAGAYVSLQGAKSLVNTSDIVSQNSARLNNVTTNFDNDIITDDLEQMIFDKAQDAGVLYTDMVDKVSRFGNNASDAFNSSDGVVAFTDLLNKQMLVDGAAVFEVESAMLQLSQALGAGRLQGEELNAVLEASPSIIQHIADSLGVTKGEIKNLASEGVITADVITNAIFGAADTINESFESMPRTWGQIWATMQNQAVVALEPVTQKLSDIANSQEFQTFALNLANAMAIVGNVILTVVNLSISFGNYITNNLSAILPMITAVVGTFMMYNVVLKTVTATLAVFKASKMAVNVLLGISEVVIGAVKLATMAYNVVNLLMAGGMTIAALATDSLTASMRTLGATMLPAIVVMGKIILAAVIVAAAFGFVIAMVVKTADTTQTAMGTVCAIMAVTCAIIWNLFVTLANSIITIVISLWNLFATFANFFANFLNDPVNAVINLVYEMFDIVASIVQAIARMFDTLFKTDMSGFIQTIRDGVSSVADSLVGEQKVIFEQLNPDDYMLNTIELQTAWNSGASFGDGLSNYVTDLFGTTNDDTINDNILNYEDYLNFDELLNGIDDISGNLNDVGNGVSDIADNTALMNDELDRSADELKYIRELAEQESINRFTTNAITVNMGGITNNVKEKSDLDGIIDYVVTSVEEALEKMPEGA